MCCARDSGWIIPRLDNALEDKGVNRPVFINTDCTFSLLMFKNLIPTP